MRQAAVEKIALEWKYDPETLPFVKQCARSDNDSDVRQAAVEEIALEWEDDPELFELLGDAAINDPFDLTYNWENNPRQTALEYIIL